MCVCINIYIYIYVFTYYVYTFIFIHILILYIFPKMSLLRNPNKNSIFCEIFAGVGTTNYLDA